MCAERVSRFSFLQRNTSLAFAGFIGALFFCLQVLLSIFAPAFEANRLYGCLIMSLVGLTAGCAGWTFGIFLSPVGSQINGAQKVLAGLSLFWSGVVVSHWSELAGLFDTWQKSSATSATKIELLFGVGIFLLAICVTFNTRIIPAANLEHPPNSPS
jgi:hypothetical protein